MSRELTVPKKAKTPWGIVDVTKHPTRFPEPTLKLLKRFPIEWDTKTSVSNKWRRSYEHFLHGTFKGVKYLFVLKGSAYGRTYWVYREDDKKPIIKVQNLEQLMICLKALTSETKGEMIQYLIHPNDKLRKLAETKVREFDSV